MPLTRNLLTIGDISSYDYTCVGGNLRIKTPAFVNDQTPGNVPLVYLTPVTLPTDPLDNAVLVEVFDNCSVWWIFDASTTTWVEETRFCQPDPSEVTNVQVGGKIIATHDDGLGNLINIRETITAIVDNGNGTFTYTDENGNDTILSVCTMLDDCNPVPFADAVDDVVVTPVPLGSVVRGTASDNDTLCNVGNTTFATTGVPVNGVVNTFNPITAGYVFTPAAVGAWSFQYNILCNGVVIDTATVSGTTACDSSTGCGCLACGNNVLPTVNFTMFGLQADVLVPFQLNPRVDPIRNEIISIEWGDGTSESFPTNTSSITHIYAFGLYNITGTIRDKITGYITTHTYYNISIDVAGAAYWTNISSAFLEFNGTLGNFRVITAGTIDVSDCEEYTFDPNIDLFVPSTILVNTTEFKLTVNGVSQTQLVTGVSPGFVPVIGWDPFVLPSTFGPVETLYEWREIGGSLIATGTMVLEKYCV